MSNQSDYVTMSSIKVKAVIFSEKNLQEIQKGNLIFYEKESDKSPEEKLYIRSFQYDKFPENISNDEKVLLQQIINKNKT